MKDSRLYLVPCNNPQSNRYFERTVLTGIEENNHTTIDELNHGDMLHFWGISQQKWQRYPQMGPGDFLLFYLGDGVYRYAAEVIEIEQNRELIQNLKSDFSQTKGGIAGLEQWEYCIYLQSPFSVEIDSRRLHDYAGHSGNQPFNFSQMNKQGREAINEKYGGIGAYLRSQSIEQTDELSNQPDSESSRQLESVESVVHLISQNSSSSVSTIDKDVSKLHQRNVPLDIIYQIVKEKHDSTSESSIIEVDAVGIVRAARLYDAGYKTIRALANTSDSKLADVHEISRKSAHVIKEHSQELISDKNTAKEIALHSDDSVAEIEKTLRVVGATGVARSEAQSIVSRLHTHPSILDIHRLQRRVAYHLMDQGYETSKGIAEADPDALTEVPQVGDGNVEIIQENAREFAGKMQDKNSTSSPFRLTNLDKEQKEEVARILGIDSVDSLNDEEWDAVLSHFFRRIINSPFDFQFKSDI